MIYKLGKLLRVLSTRRNIIMDMKDTNGQVAITKAEVESQKSTILNDCIKRWQPVDAICKKAIEAYPTWIKQMSENLREIVEIQMSFFDYYSHAYVNSFLADLHERLQSIEGVGFSNTIYTVLSSRNGHLNSGSYYLIEYKEINKISKYVVFPSFEQAFDKLQYVDNIVLVDDFCGSGKTFIDFVKERIELLKNKSIYYLVIHAMSRALIEIEEFAIQNSLKIKVLHCNCTDKAFLRNDELKNRKEEYTKESKKLGIPENYILGYKDSESLTAFYNDTPNNTLGIYWSKGNGFTPLFPRKDDKRPNWKSMKSDKKKRQENNYINYVRNQNG